MASEAPPPEVDLSSQFEKEKNDPSMIAYLKSLGIDPDYKAPSVRHIPLFLVSYFCVDISRRMTLVVSSSRNSRLSSRTGMLLSLFTSKPMRI